MSAISSVRAGVVVAIVTALALSTSCHGDHAPRGTIGAARAADAPSPPRRGLYVADTPAVIAAPDGGADLARFVHDHAISRVVLYGLGRLLGDADGERHLAALIATLRAAGVVEVGAPIAAAARLADVVDLGRRRPAARFDLVVTELEYWHACAGEDAAAGVRPCFAPMAALLDAMRAAAVAAAARGEHLRVAAYLGAPTAAEAAAIAARADDVLLNYNVADPGRAHAGGHRRDRLRAVAATGVAIWPILYARGDGDMHAWLADHDLAAAEAAFDADVAGARGAGAPAPRIAGFQYFPYEALRDLAGPGRGDGGRAGP